MVKRGGQCNNPTKVRNIQEFGGTVAVIIDKFEESLDDFVMDDSSSLSSNGAITIPAYMIDKNAGNLIKD